MAYAALVSLENTIHRTLNHPMFSVSLQEKQQILSLLEHVSSFQGTLEAFPDKLNCLEGRMREVAEEAEDILEYFVLKKVSSSSEDQHGLRLKRVMREIYLIAETLKGSSSSKSVQVEARSWAKQLKSKIIDTKFYSFCKNLRHCVPPGVQGGVGSSIGSSSSNAGAPPKIEDVMVDFEEYVLHVKERLCAEEPKLQVIPICGMGGIGKTTLAKNVYDDPLIVETYDVRVWITVSQDYTAQRILSSLLHSLKEFDTGRLGKMDEEKVYKILKCRRYLVVMDDIWSSEAWDVVRRVCPDDGNGSRVLLTTRLSDVASYPDSSSKICEMQLMGEDQSWNLFKQKVFGVEDCPSGLQNTGKEIARSCGGLPLAIVVIAGVVSTVSKSLASWQEIAKNVKKSADQNQIEEILALSYFQLPQYIRPCFLYMGSFPEDEEINVTKLIRLWVAEGFLKPPAELDTFETVAEECLEQLVRRNLVLVIKRKWNGRIKSCGLHDLMRDLCIRKAQESKFFLNLTNRPCLEKKIFIESIKNHRRLIVNSSNLWDLSSSCNSAIRSIKCWQYFVVYTEFLGSVRLLRVLDAEPAKVEDSPLMEQVDRLFHLRYLAMINSGCYLSCLSNLKNLQTLVIHSVKNYFIDGVRYLLFPWCMPQLRHIYFHGTIHFCDPEETAYSLGSLQTVSYVSHHSCTERILKRIPNLKKLKVNCSGGPHRGEAACLNDLVHLHRLESLELLAGRFLESRPKYYNLTYPKVLKKLVLRNLVLPWNEIAVVGSLPNLQVLKLKGCTCVGGIWETTEGELPQVEFLLIEDCDFKNWITESSHFPRLRRLLLHSCRNLSEIPTDIGEIPTLEVIEVKYATKSLVESAEVIRNEQEDYGNNTLQVICHHETSDSDEFAYDNYDREGGEDEDDNETKLSKHETCDSNEFTTDCTYGSEDGEDKDDHDDEALEELLGLL